MMRSRHLAVLDAAALGDGRTWTVSGLPAESATFVDKPWKSLICAPIRTKRWPRAGRGGVCVLSPAVTLSPSGILARSGASPQSTSSVGPAPGAVPCHQPMQRDVSAPAMSALAGAYCLRRI